MSELVYKQHKAPTFNLRLHFISKYIYVYTYIIFYTCVCMCWDMNSHLHKYTLIRISIKIDPHIYPQTRTYTHIHKEKYFSTIIGLPIYNVIHTLLIRKFCTCRDTHTPEIFMYNSILFLFLIHSHKYNSLIFIWHVRVCTGIHVCVYVCIHLSGQDYLYTIMLRYPVSLSM